MQSFLEGIVSEISSKEYPFEHLVFILPSKRAGTFLKKAIAQNTASAIFAPEIYSIEGFVEEVSGLTYASSTQQLFTLYEAYLEQPLERKDDFYGFSKWAQTLLQDFNEIDRYLVDTSQLFSNLAAIQEINHWSLQENKTKMMADYLKFWNHLEAFYHSFNDKLLDKGLGHQGLVYRRACDALADYLAKHKGKRFLFVGFNALNTAESQIIQQTLASVDADIYWDLDSYFLEDPVHDASLFIRQHLKNWPYFKNTGPKGISNNYRSPKNIEIIGIPKNVSQAKYTGELLGRIHRESPDALKNTAVVLGDESLMNALLNSVPAEVKGINITMGYPLDKTPLASLFDQFLDLYISRSGRSWFHRNVESVLGHPYVQVLFNRPGQDGVANALETIRTMNMAYLDADRLDKLIDNKYTSLIFSEHDPTPTDFLKRCTELVLALREKFDEKRDALALEYLYKFYTLFNQLDELVQEHPFITDLKSLQALYRDLLSAESLDFQGEPLEGLQIMGMLESRNLDFETVILTSVNEGILPSGKSNNSFIPFDLKVRLGLPTYKEKDAVYTYHFYRLLQRAKNVYILYNTEPDVLEGGERSRLISQLLTDANKYPEIKETIAAPTIGTVVRPLETVQKNGHLLSLIKEHAAKGFSPTSLSNYIRNPIDFYKRNLLGIDDVLEVEETIAANTFGTIVHDTLEELYTPFVNRFLTEEGLLEAKGRITGLVKKHFTKTYLEGDIGKGKNLIAYNVVLRYIENFIDLEIRETKAHQVKILALEKKLNAELDIDGVDFPVRLKGKLDRIDERDGVLRIIDYKTGMVSQGQVEVVEWGELISDYEYSKAFQLLCYALMYNAHEPISAIESGIFTFKNLGSGLLRFATKESRTSRKKKDYLITQDTLALFSEELKRLILEICNVKVPFTEKEV
ncbi:PD-(D/E)XK nuclease family protein [Pseudozobellia thermophila]|uniref:PD-(D/E)XK nuclease superfamily protein n=1 Tax=Pseudozobellia thermophila TaxID=192903 RepID=A0A1M6B6Z7_9FLAO|nr:PD-(D/E)XK nuclease family protein [Pseudozobellia thermophila]SHI44529.1 PD-(D/E)XK nuclease superfamily protein [Pseudozobellia thermophila]